MKPTSRCSATMLVTSLLVVSAVACGSNKQTSTQLPFDSSTTPHPSASPTALALASSSPHGAWVSIRDAASGAQFALPARAEPQLRSQPGGASATVYAAQAQGVGLAVAIYRTPTVVPGYAAAVYSKLISSLRDAGAKDAKLSALRTMRLGTSTASDATVTFTALDGAKMYWRQRIIETGKVIIQLQGLPVKAAAKSSPSELATIDRLFEKLARSVRIG